MFRLDEMTVVDATTTGGPARFINHSCKPNCFTEVLAVSGLEVFRILIVVCSSSNGAFRIVPFDQLLVKFLKTT